MTSAMTNQKPAVTLEFAMSQLILTSIAGSHADSYGKVFFYKNDGQSSFVWLN